MQKKYKLHAIFMSALFACLTLTLSNATPVTAQHIDTFKLGPGGRGELAERSRHPDAPESGVVKVEDHYSYEVVLEKEKIDNGTITIRDIDLVELSEADRGMYEWHQAETFDELDIVQKHTRVVGKLKCNRQRKGVVYWALNGLKYVAWQTWSSWSCTKEE